MILIIKVIIEEKEKGNLHLEEMDQKILILIHLIHIIVIMEKVFQEGKEIIFIKKIN